MNSILLDSNILIYGVRPEFPELHHYLLNPDAHASEATRVEVLGYHRLTDQEAALLEATFQRIHCLAIDDAVVAEAIRLRRQRSMKLGDAFIAATAQVHDLTLLTHNIKDFAWIHSLRLIDPVTTERRPSS